MVDMRDVGSPVFDTLYAILLVSGPCEDQHMVARSELSRYISLLAVIIFLINIGTS